MTDSIESKEEKERDSGNRDNGRYLVNDYLWPIVRPRGGSTEAIAEMNARLLAFAPDSPARDNHELLQYARRIVYDESDVSVAQIFRSIIR